MNLETVKKYILPVLIAIVVFAAGYWAGGSGNSNNDDPRVQRIYDSVARIESFSGTIDAGLGRIEQAAAQGEAGTQRVIGGIGTAIELMENSEQRERDSARNREAAQERIIKLENIFYKIYQREQAKEK